MATVDPPKIHGDRPGGGCGLELRAVRPAGHFDAGGNHAPCCATSRNGMKTRLKCSPGARWGGKSSGLQSSTEFNQLNSNSSSRFSHFVQLNWGFPADFPVKTRGFSVFCPRSGIKTLLSLSSTLQDIPPRDLLVGAHLMAVGGLHHGG